MAEPDVKAVALGFGFSIGALGLGGALEGVVAVLALGVGVIDLDLDFVGVTDLVAGVAFFSAFSVLSVALVSRLLDLFGAADSDVSGGFFSTAGLATLGTDGVAFLAAEAVFFRSPTTLFTPRARDAFF